MCRQLFMLVLFCILATIVCACDGDDDQPDLVPANPGGWFGFCDVDDQNRLVFYVKNQGADVLESTITTIDFGQQYGIVQRPTPPIAPGQTVTLDPVVFPFNCFNPDCDFTITVDSLDEIEESNEANNSVNGRCIG